MTYHAKIYDAPPPRIDMHAPYQQYSRGRHGDVVLG